MVKYKIALFALMLLVLNSCSTTNYSIRSITIDKNPVITNDVIVDVKVDATKSITATSDKRLSVNLAKNEAYYKAITENNIDIVIDPIFEIKTIGRKCVVKLTGYAGYYTNPRTKTEAVKELQSVKLENVATFQKMFNPTLFESKNKIVKNQSVNNSVNVLNSGLKFFKPIASANEQSKKIEISILNSQNVFKSNTFGDSDNNGIAFVISYDSNPNRKIGVNSELLYSFNSDFDHISKTLYLRYSLFSKLNLLAGPSVLHFFDSDFNDFNIGYSVGATYSFGNKLSVKFKTSQFANVMDDSGMDVSYSSINFGVGYKF